MILPISCHDFGMKFLDLNKRSFLELGKIMARPWQDHGKTMARSWQELGKSSN
jgi:hypothetical protein